MFHSNTARRHRSYWNVVRKINDSQLPCSVNSKLYTRLECYNTLQSTFTPHSSLIIKSTFHSMWSWRKRHISILTAFVALDCYPNWFYDWAFEMETVAVTVTWWKFWHFKIPQSASLLHLERSGLQVSFHLFYHTTLSI